MQMPDFLKSKPSAEKAAAVLATLNSKRQATAVAADEARREYQATSLAVEYAEPGAEAARDKARKALEQAEARAADADAALAGAEALQSSVLASDAAEAEKRRQAAEDVTLVELTRCGAEVDTEVDVLVEKVRAAFEWHGKHRH